MVLKIKHSPWYYKKFQTDIWGIVYTTPKFQFQPTFPTYEQIFHKQWDYFCKIKRIIKEKVTKENYLQYGDYFVKKYRKIFRSPIKRTSRQNTVKIWGFKNKKLTKMASFLNKVWFIVRLGEEEEEDEEKKKKVRRKKWKPRFSYSLDVVKKEKKPKRMKYRFASLRLTKIFYITMTYRQFRKLARIMRRKRGAFENNFLMSLEGRLMSYIYRTSLLTNPFYCMKFIQQGHILINLKCEKHYNYKLSIYKLITFSALGKRMLYKFLLKRLSSARTYFNVPRFIYMSYLFFYNYIIKLPIRGDLVFPASTDFYRATGYAF